MGAPPAIPNVPQIGMELMQEIQARSQGRAMTALHLEMVSRRQEIEASGQLHPATILNFNPLPLRIEGNIEMTVPACNDRFPGAQHGRIAIDFKGRRHQASYVTVRTPRFWPRTTGVSKDSQSDEDMAQHSIAALLPIGIVHQFYIHYNSGANDSNGMGGVLVYQGDRHSIEADRLARHEGTILVPTRTKLKNGSHAYGTTPKPLAGLLENLFTAQRAYCNRQLQEAQALFDGAPDERKNITGVHRTWGQYAVDMGWRTTPPLWMTEELGQDVEQVKCRYCHATSEQAGAHFCTSCNAPYDPFKAFMAGLHVPPSYLMLLEGDERKQVLETLKKRREGFEEFFDFGGDDEPGARPKGKGKN